MIHDQLESCTLEDNCTIFTAIFIILQPAIQALVLIALCSSFTAMWKTNSQRKTQPLKEKYLVCNIGVFFLLHREKKPAPTKKKPQNKTSCFKWQMDTSLNILQAWTKEDLGCNIFHFPLCFGRLCLNLGCKESLNLQEAGIPNMKSEPTSCKNEWKAQATKWNRASGNNTRHLWETLPGYRVLQRMSTAAGTRHYGTNTLVEAVLAI